MDDPTKTNRLAWDEMAAIHARGSVTYPVEAFKAGQAGLTPNTPDDLGNVRGKHMLHLQCHFGMDSLMWVRQGAVVTGVDFSPAAVAQARELSAQTALAATFIEADVAELPEHLSGQFDIVLAYYGVMPWVGNLPGWARGIVRCLRPGGFFYLADTHPLAEVMEVPQDERVPRLCHPYFTDGQPACFETNGGTYANPTAQTRIRTRYEWQHTLQDILGSLLAAGLRLEYLHEFPHCFYERYYPDRKLMRQDEQGWWHLLEGDGLVPLMFSLKAVR